jgi:hypothetical protein
VVKGTSGFLERRVDVRRVGLVVLAMVWICIVCASIGGSSARITMDRLGTYAAAKARLPGLADVEHVHVRSADSARHVGADQPAALMFIRVAREQG